MVISQDDRNDILLMIQAQIDQYDKKQEMRHCENIKKFDEIRDIMATIKFSRENRAWIFPTVISAILLLIELIKLK
jgi:hypothetical protein